MKVFIFQRLVNEMKTELYLLIQITFSHIEKSKGSFLKYAYGN